jgi:hypothetical protein
MQPAYVPITIAAKMANSIDQSKELHQRHLPTPAVFA